MESDGLAPRSASRLFSVDDDGPPPRKKVSRFFPGGKSLIGSDPGNIRKLSENNANTTPLIEDHAYTAQPHAETSITDSTDPFKAATIGLTSRNGEDRLAQSSALPRMMDPLRNRFSQAATALQNLTVRNRRREGIVGMSSLLQPGLDIPIATHVSTQAGGGSVVGQPMKPFQSTPFQAGPLSSEDAVLIQASYRSSNQLPSHVSTLQSRSQQLGTSQPFRQLQRLPSNSSPPHEFLTSQGLRRRGPGLTLQEDQGPLNAPPPQYKSSKVPLNDTGFQQPFLPRPTDIAAGIDLDRDVAGKRLPAQARHPILNLPGKGITNLPQHATLTPSRRFKGIPPTFYTSPGRIQNAIQFSRKRKRTALIPPPPAFTYQRTNDPFFNVFNGVLLYPELVFHLASILPLRDLISLYAISRDFHTIIDTRFTTVVLSQSLRKAPECSRAFPFRCYAHLCRKDPAARIPHPNPQAAALGRVRLIPSFRWLALILHREKVVHEIMALFAEDGVPLPKRCSLAIKRMWFILDIPDNARRIGYIHNVHLFTDLDLYFAMCFFVKLDMRMNDPVGQQKRDGMRKMLLAQESFTTVLKALRRDMWQKQFDVMRAWIRYKYDPLPDEQGMSIFGVPFEEVGKLRFEYWGRAMPRNMKRVPQLLLRPDQLVMREAVKRGLRFHKHFLRCLTYGYVRMDTLEDYEPRRMSRRKESLKDEYGVDDEIGGLTWSMEKAGLEDAMDDDVLDLGERKSVSLLCIEGGNRSMVSREDQLRMEEQEQFLEACMQWSEAEREAGDVNAKMLLD